MARPAGGGDGALLHDPEVEQALGVESSAKLAICIVLVESEVMTTSSGLEPAELGDGVAGGNEGRGARAGGCGGHGATSSPSSAMARRNSSGIGRLAVPGVVVLNERDALALDGVADQEVGASPS